MGQRLERGDSIRPRLSAETQQRLDLSPEGA